MLTIGESHRGRRLPMPRTFRDRTNPLDVLDDDEVIRRYRLPRQSIIDLCEALADDLDRATNRSLPTSTQVMAALQYFATGSFQRVDGDLHGISQPSVSRCVNAVSTALCRRASTYIKFAADEASQRHVIGQFHDIAGFPNVLGCVDGTQIPILAPRVNEYVYVCTTPSTSKVCVTLSCGSQTLWQNTRAAATTPSSGRTVQCVCISSK